MRALSEDAGATDGERAAARSTLEKMAARAGIDLATAEAMCREDPPRRSTSWEAHWERERRQDEERFREAVRRYGPAEPVFAETERERRLREQLEPLAVRRTYSNSSKTYVAGFFDWFGGRDPSPLVLGALDLAEPLPQTVTEALAEWRDWQALWERRLAYVCDYDTPPHVRCRESALQWLIVELPARSWSEFDARLAWSQDRILEGVGWFTAEDHADFLERIAADTAALRKARVPRRWGRRGSQPGQAEFNFGVVDAGVEVRKAGRVS